MNSLKVYEKSIIKEKEHHQLPHDIEKLNYVRKFLKLFSFCFGVTVAKLVTLCQYLCAFSFFYFYIGMCHLSALFLLEDTIKVDVMSDSTT